MVARQTGDDKLVCIQQLRSQLEEYPPFQDEYLERFLIARSWNVEAAKMQLVASLEWRKENGIDVYPVADGKNNLPVLYPVRGYKSLPDQNLTAQPGVSEAVLRIYRYMGGSCLHKVDKDGCPIYIERLGYHKAKDLAKHTTAEEIYHYHVGCNEFLHRVVMQDCSAAAGRVINRETVIFDCTGMGWHQFHMPAIQLIRTIADVDQKYYPETLNKLFLVNAPGAFVYVWKLVKGWLDPGTISKIKILGSDYKQELLDQIPAENLPTFLGGTCECDHVSGGCVPSQVLKNTEPVVPGQANEQVVTAYNSDIMDRAKTNPDYRGACRFGID
ncbi:CRAL/TRIO domain-containing protein [Hesseltinella vesiculosa]|uniref:CRAL/TRIO domain-containing protein n=1 Tax=Hesseltinella vesiculosa TaxID=101127 RepID=A0A1X2G9F8_9FUNG|nr:CRAL/TRIO domain-containing protein [Hesseltinella vesiculosa]